MRKKQNVDISSLEQEANKQANVMYDFEALLDKSKSLDEKKRILWKQIYRNAVDDRATAASLFNGAYQTIGNSAQDHLAMGATLVKYLEKMSKSNQQLLELSQLISRDEEQNTKIDPEDMFKRIEEENA